MIDRGTLFTIIAEQKDCLMQCIIHMMVTVMWGGLERRESIRSFIKITLNGIHYFLVSTQRTRIVDNKI
jgi:hypothetical protein